MALFRRIANLFSRSRINQEIHDELRAHIEMRIDDNIAAGMSPEAARRDALLKFGNPTMMQERVTHVDTLLGLDTLFRDLRYAGRMLWRSKGFTAVAVGSLALGIGANTIIFSLAKGVLMDQLAVPHPEQLKMVTLIAGDKSPVQSSWGSWFSLPNGDSQYALLTYPIYTMLQEQDRSHPVLQDLFAFKDLQNNRLTMTFDGHAETVKGEMVSGNFYSQLGIRPELGRAIQSSEDGAPNTGNVLMISDGLWSRMFGRAPDVIGKTIQLNFIPMTIVGVNPPGFTGGSSVQMAPDVFFPLSMQPTLAPGQTKGHPSYLDDKDQWWVQVMTRQRPETPLATANVALQTWIEQDIRATMKLDKENVMPTVTLADGSRGIDAASHAFATQIYVLSVLTGLILLLACANLANLLLARSASRQREIAVRLALGASRARVLRQVLTESLLLSTLGGIAGLVLGYAGRNVIPHLYSASWQVSSLRADFDGTIFAFAATISVLTSMLFGVAPASRATRVETNAGLKDSAGATTRRRRGLAGPALVVVQVALSMLLVVGAGLFAGTLLNLYKEQLGFNAQNILVFSVQAPEARYPAPRDVQLHERIEERLTLIPGINGVSLSRNPLVGGASSGWGFIPMGQAPRSGRDGVASVHEVSRSFFDVYQIPVLSGRGFNSADTSTSLAVGVINQTLANKFWPNSNPVGKTYTMDDGPRIFTVIGIVADTKYSRLDRDVPPTVYFPYEQSDGAREKEMNYEIKTGLPITDMSPQIRAAVAEIDHDLPVRDMRTQQAQINATISQQRTFAVLTGAFGILALVLACIGIYGLMAYDVARRTSEIGIRMALGAQASQMLRMVLREASWMAVVGIATGLSGALLLTRYVKSMLYGLAPNDPWILGGAGLLLFAVALLAGWGPARRASHIEPMEALRHE